MIFLIDSDEEVRAALGTLLTAAQRPFRTYPDVSQFLKTRDHAESGVILMNFRQGADTALGMLHVLRERGVDFPVVVHSGDSDTQQIVRTIREGAADYLAKPVQSERLLASLDAAQSEEDRRHEPRTVRLAALAKLAELTPREREVLERLLQGDRNKAAAAYFDIAPKTVEHHRAAIFRKLGVKSLAAAAIHYDAAKVR